MTNPPHSAEVRKYLVDKGIAPLLEQFMADVIEHRPDDVLGFLKQWAIDKHAMTVGIADAASEEAAAAAPAVAADEAQGGMTPCDSVVDLRDPLEVVSASWKQVIQPTNLQTAVVESFFQMLFLQKPILKKTMFDGVDIAKATERLVPLIDATFTGALRDVELTEFCKEVAIGKGVEEKHIASFLTAMHAAVATKVPEAEWENLNIPLNKYLREMSVRISQAIEEAEQIFAVESQHEVGGGAGGAEEGAREGECSDDEEAAREKKEETRTAAELVQDSWTKLPEAQQQAALKETVETLFVQHAILTKGPLKDISVDELVSLLKPIVNDAADGSLTAEKAGATAFTKQANERGLQPKHVDYLVTALLGSLSRHFGAQRWQILNDAWTAVLTSAALTFKNAAFPEAS